MAIDWGQVQTVADKQAAAALLAYNNWKDARDQLIANSTVIENGVTYSANEDAQQRLARIILYADLNNLNNNTIFEWNRHDGTVISITLTRIKNIYNAAVLNQLNNWNVGNPL